MYTRTKRPLAALLLLLAVLASCSSSGHHFHGQSVSDDVAKALATVPGLDLASHHLSVYRTINETWFISVDGAQPSYPKGTVDKDYTAAVALAQNMTGTYTTRFNLPALQDVNPLTFTVSQRALTQPRYVVYTDDQAMLRSLVTQSNVPDNPGLGFTRQEQGFVVTFINTKNLTPSATEPIKAIATEMCNSFNAVTPTDDVVTRAAANNVRTGGHIYTRTEMSGKVQGIIQEAFCNSFGLAAQQAQAGVSYNDYTPTTNVYLVMLGSPQILTMPQQVYQQLA